MDINFTFFIQLFHFLVAYFVLEKLLFKPSINTIELEQKHYNNLITTINNQQKLLKDKEDWKLQAWNGFKLQFVKAMPEKIVKKPLMRSEIIQPLNTISHEEQKEYEHALQKTLLKRLRHAS